MLRLMEILLHTPDVGRLREFYEKTVGLDVMTASPSWTAYATGGALLALSPVTDGEGPRAELTFSTDDLDAVLRDLRSHGIEPTGEIMTKGWGRLARFRDSDDNAIAIAQLNRDVETRNGLSLGTAIVHTRDMAAAKAFYHHALGLKLVVDEPGWVEFQAGDSRVALRDRTAPGGRPLAFGFEIEGLMEWAEEARDRGLHFATAPRAEDWGLFSDTLDPDGHRVTFFEPAEPSGIEEELAEAFEDDAVPHQATIRRPVKKGTKAASKVAIKPEYKKPPGKPARKRPSATTQAVAKVRGSGPERTRATPKRTADEKKARGKVAIGRLKKAAVAGQQKKRTAAARMSKGKPVKKRAARRGRGK